MIFRAVIFASCLALTSWSAARADLTAQVGGGGTGPSGRWIAEKSDSHSDSLNQAASASVSAESQYGSYHSQVTTSRGAGNTIQLQADFRATASASLPTAEPPPDTGVPSILAYAFATYSEKLMRIQVPQGFTKADDTYVWFVTPWNIDVSGGAIGEVYLELSADGHLELHNYYDIAGGTIKASGDFGDRRSVAYLSTHDLQIGSGLRISVGAGNLEGQYKDSGGSLSIAFDLQFYLGDIDGRPVPGAEGIRLFTESGAEIPLLTAAGSSLPFFHGQAALSDGAYYLAFPNGNPFGYYSYLSDPRFLYHFDLGYEYVFDANDGRAGVYLYDFKSGGFFYTSPGFAFPYLYDFSLNSVVYYYPDPSRPGRYNTDGYRFFYVFNTGQIIVK